MAFKKVVKPLEIKDFIGKVLEFATQPTAEQPTVLVNVYNVETEKLEQNNVQVLIGESYLSKIELAKFDMYIIEQNSKRCTITPVEQV